MLHANQLAQPLTVRDLSTVQNFQYEDGTAPTGKRKAEFGDNEVVPDLPYLCDHRRVPGRAVHWLVCHMSQA